jgi:hypothetical protein
LSLVLALVLVLVLDLDPVSDILRIKRAQVQFQRENLIRLIASL